MQKTVKGGALGKGRRDRFVNGSVRPIKDGTSSQ